MISISGKAMTEPAAIPEGWELLTISEVDFEENPNASILYKITFKVTSDKICAVTDHMKVDFPIWSRQNKDGTQGGEYDLSRLVKATGINVTTDENGNATFNYEEFRNKRFVGMIYRKPGGKYSEVYTGYVLSEQDLDDESKVNYANESFESYLGYLKTKSANVAEKPSAQQSLFGQIPSSPAAVISGDVDDDGIPF